MEAIRSSETSVSTYKATKRHTPHVHNPNSPHILSAACVPCAELVAKSDMRYIQNFDREFPWEKTNCVFITVNYDTLTALLLH